jgi:hypothetical protein
MKTSIGNVPYVLYLNNEYKYEAYFVESRDEVCIADTKEICVELLKSSFEYELDNWVKDEFEDLNLTYET